LRGAICQRANVPREILRSDTDLLNIIPQQGRAEMWRTIGDELGAIKFWPRLANPGWLESFRSPRLNLLGTVAKFMVARSPCVLLRKEEGWSRRLVAEVVHGLISEQIGLTRDRYTEDSRWAQDMGVD
jgi:hypothetical protein